MFINFIYFFLFLTCFSSVGGFFNKHYLNYESNKNDILSTNNLISALFIFGFFTVLFNFFLPLNSIIVKIFFLILIFFSITTLRNELLYNFKENFLLSLLISLICFYMEAGYDGALYHLPHQNFIKDYKIIFGLFNLHERFGIISIYSYISSLFWVSNDLIILTFVQGIFYFILFKFLIDYIKCDNILKKALAIGTVIFIPIWIRYVQPSFALVDFPTGVIFCLAFLKGVEVLNFKENFKDNFKIFLILSGFLFALKSSNLIFVIYSIFITFIVLKKKQIKLKEVVLFLIIPSLLVLFWIIKTFINTGCLIFPLPTLCFDTSWSDIELTKIILNEIFIYGKIYTTYLSLDNVIGLIKSKLFLTIFCIMIFLISLIVLCFIFFKKKINYLLISTIFFSNIIIILGLEPIIGFSSLIKSGVSEERLLGKEIFFKEVFFILFFIFSSLAIVYFLYFNKINIKFIKITTLTFYPLVFVIFFLFIWIYLSPNPRFGIGHLSIIPCSIILLFSKQFVDFTKIKNIYLILFFFVYVILIVNILVKKRVNFNDLFSLPTKKIDNIVTIKRKGFGVLPIRYCDAFSTGNLCWIEKNCYFIENDANIEYLKFNYLLIKKITDRKHPKCVKR